MAKKTVEKFYSDLSGDEIDTPSPTVAFTFDGVGYEVDLTEAERQTFADAVAPYVAVGRRAGRASGRSSSSRRSSSSSGSSRSPARPRSRRAASSGSQAVGRSTWRCAMLDNAPRPPATSAGGRGTWRRIGGSVGRWRSLLPESASPDQRSRTPRRGTRTEEPLDIEMPRGS